MPTRMRMEQTRRKLVAGCLASSVLFVELSRGFSGESVPTAGQQHTEFSQKSGSDSGAALTAVLKLEQSEAIASRRKLLMESGSDLPTSPPAWQWAMGMLRTADGWRAVPELAELAEQDAVLAQYRQERDSRALTSTRHRELADWCLQHGLKSQEKAHLWQSLKGDSQQPALWKRLGYQFVDGVWCSPEQLALIQHRQQQRTQNLQRWKGQAQAIAKRLASPQAGIQAAARSQLLAIQDVNALPALESQLSLVTAPVAVEYLNWLKSRPEVDATLSLARQSVLSPWQETRELAADLLVSRRKEHFVPPLLDLLHEHDDYELQVAQTLPGRFGAPLLVANFRREFRDFVEHRRQRIVLGVPQVIVRQLITQDRSDPADVLMANQGRFLAQSRAIEDGSRELARLTNSFQESRQAIDYQPLVEQALQRATAANDISGPTNWWRWWAQVTATELASTTEKPTIEISEFESYQPQFMTFTGIASFGRLPHSCLPAGTTVFTELGPRAIETIRPGDRVLSKQIQSGEVAYQPVLDTTVRSPQPLVTLKLAQSEITATRGHYFWVSGRGWRMASEIQPGDRLHTLEGTQTIQSIESGSVAAVYNLVVDRARSYFVGDALVLSHDVTTPQPTDILVPGLAVK